MKLSNGFFVHLVEVANIQMRTLKAEVEKGHVCAMFLYLHIHVVTYARIYMHM